MNVSKWNAYRLAVLMSYEYPNSFGVETWRKTIREHLGTDRRTVEKYQNLMRDNGYVIQNKESNKFSESWKVNPDIENMKPRSLKHLIAEKKRENEG